MTMTHTAAIKYLFHMDEARIEQRVEFVTSDVVTGFSNGKKKL